MQRINVAHDVNYATIRNNRKVFLRIRIISGAGVVCTAVYVYMDSFECPECTLSFKSTSRKFLKRQTGKMHRVVSEKRNTD